MLDKIPTTIKKSKSVVKVYKKALVKELDPLFHLGEEDEAAAVNQFDKKIREMTEKRDFVDFNNINEKSENLNYKAA